MARIGTLAVIVGVVAGAWAIILSYFGSFQPSCFGVPCPSDGLLSTLTSAFAVVLIVDSLACLIAPRKAFYASALLGAVLAGLVGYGGIYAGTWFYISVIVGLLLAASTVVLGLFAARSGGSVSEQEHPMNLPVFG